jgi:HK97 family phage major capsid protein
MARTTFESNAWVPEEVDSQVIQRITSVSVIEKLARRVSMGTDTKLIPRSGDVGVEVVPKGSAYGEDVTTDDEITLVAKKLGKMVRIAEEDIDDSPQNIISIKQLEWASSYARYLDNAAVATTGAVGAGVPFTSVYRALSQANAATGYTANANITKTAAGVAVTYENLSQALGKREGSLYFDPSKEVILADTSFKATLRELKDGDGRYIFSASPRQGDPDTLFGYPIEWSQGLRTSATATSKPAGNPLMVFGNRDFLILGVRSGPESIVIDGRDGASAATDETLLKMRARRAFAIGHENAFQILEKVPAV